MLAQACLTMTRVSARLGLPQAEACGGKRPQTNNKKRCVLVGKSDAQSARKENRGGPTLPSRCCCAFQPQRTLQTPDSPTNIQRRRNSTACDGGSKYLPVRDVLVEKLLLINLVRKARSGAEIREMATQRVWRSACFTKAPLK